MVLPLSERPSSSSPLFPCQVHCLAGAHRAGTTGVACLIHFAKLDVPMAIMVAKVSAGVSGGILWCM
jgi:hypothetical protein